MSASYSRLARALAPALAHVTRACFATRSDVQLLQTDVSHVRADFMRADSVRAAQLDRVIETLGAATDTLKALSARTQRAQADQTQSMYSLEQQLIQVQELTGQSQRRLQELRAQLESRGLDASLAGGSSAPGAGAAADSARPTGTARPTATTPAGGPGPNQLFQLSLDQLRRGNAQTARGGFEELIRQYPSHEVAPAARFYLGEALTSLGKRAEADSQYVAVYTRTPKSDRAATALYKHALNLQQAGDAEAARTAFERVVKQYPRSDEAELSRERLQRPGK